MKARVPKHQSPREFVIVDTEATVGATVGVNLRNLDGSLFVPGGPAAPGQYAPFSLVGPLSVLVQSSQGASTAVVALVGDSAAPGSSHYYGTNAAGVKGFYPASTLPAVMARVSLRC